MKNTPILIFGLIMIMLMSCNKPSIDTVEDLMNVDIEFSAYAEKYGFSKAFIAYVHPEGILLRQNSMPIVGRNDIEKYMNPLSDSPALLTWQPLSARISSSGDMGFTYGTYKMKMDTVTREGTYVSIWEKTASGKWKYILDTGNEGLSP